MMHRTDETLTVVDRHGVTVLERPAGTNAVAQRSEAIRVAAQVGGKVFELDRDGFLTRIWPEASDNR